MIRLRRTRCPSIPAARAPLSRGDVDYSNKMVRGEMAIEAAGQQRRLRWPGYYYRANHPKLDDADWHGFTGSKYDAKTGEWQMSKLPVHHIV